MTHVATSLDYILGLNLKGRWIINLLKITGEVALVIILPLYETTDLVSELRVTDVASSFIHGALVAELECRCFSIVEKTASLVASLVLKLAADDVENERITRDLLVLLYLDYITGLDTAPICDLEALMALRKYELLDWLLINFLSRLL